MNATATPFYKKPSFIALAIILFSLLILPFIQLKDGRMTFTASSVQCLFEGGDISGVDGKYRAKAVEQFWAFTDKSDSGIGAPEKISVILILISVFLLYIEWKGTNDETIFKSSYVKPAKIALLSVCLFYLLRYLAGLGIDGKFSEYVSPGFGLWICVLAAIFIQFEEKIMSQFKSAPKPSE